MMTAPKVWTWPLIWQELRRCIGVTLLGWMQCVWPKSDIRVHRAIGEVARAASEDAGTEL